MGHGKGHEAAACHKGLWRRPLRARPTTDPCGACRLRNPGATPPNYRPMPAPPEGARLGHNGLRLGLEHVHAHEEEGLQGDAPPRCRKSGGPCRGRASERIRPSHEAATPHGLRSYHKLRRPGALMASGGAMAPGDPVRSGTGMHCMGYLDCNNPHGRMRSGDRSPASTRRCEALPRGLPA